MSDYYYYEENGKLFRFHLEVDDQPWNPRKDMDGNIGTIICCRDYGDEIVDVVNYITNLLRENVSEKTIINFVKNRKADNNMELKYNRSERKWELWRDYITYIDSPTDYRRWPIKKHGLFDSTDQSVDWLVDSIIDAFTVGDMLTLLERKGYVFFPLAVYEHGPYVSMKIGSKMQFIDGQWDGSDIGFIYTTKEKVMEVCGGYYKNNKTFVKTILKNWREVAESDLKAEVELYDQYIQGECYGYVTDVYLPEDDNWDEDIDSCWGYFSSKWGEELAREIADDSITTQPFISETDAKIRMEELRTIALEEEKERLIMEQADTIVCI